MSRVSFLQVLALVFIRKLMDCIFTKREMSWLDDLMPESKKKKLEDAEEVTAVAHHNMHVNVTYFHQYISELKLRLFLTSRRRSRA